MSKSWPSQGVVVKVGGHKFEELEVLGRVQPVPQDRVSKQSMSEWGRAQLREHVLYYIQECPQASGDLERADSSMHSTIFILITGGREAGGGREVSAGWWQIGRGCCDLALEVEAQVKKANLT